MIDVVISAETGQYRTTGLSANADVRRGFSSPHLSAAAHFAGELRRYEKEHAENGGSEHFDFCRWHATASIILSFSAVEAAIDEAEDDLGLPRELTNALGTAPTLAHAQALLALRHCDPFDRGAEPYQSAELLRVLRNGLVHPKAEWDSVAVRNKQLSKKIVGAKSIRA